MDTNLGILKLASGLAQHAGQRQSVIAENIANADTPGFKAKEITKFSEAYSDTGASTAAMKTTRPGHLGSAGSQGRFEVVEAAAFGAESPNGNSVSLEDQTMKSAVARQDYDLALGVYRKSLDILRLSLGRNR